MSARRVAAVLAATTLTLGVVAVQAGAQSPDEQGDQRAGKFTVTADLEPSSVLRNETAVLSGTVKPVKTSKDVLIQREDGSGWTTVAKRPVSDEGRYRYAFKSDEAGTFTYRAKMPKVGAVRSGTSPEQELTVAEESLVVFKIKAGTGAKDWNSEGSTVTAEVGDTLRIVNNDSMAHRPHTDGAPFPNPAASIPAGGAKEYVLESAYDSNDEETLYCAIHGPSSQFWIDVVEP